jgi:hypothetical protein
MGMKATDKNKGVQLNAGRKGKGSGAVSGVGGDGTTTTPGGRQQGDRDSRSAANLAAAGNTITKNPQAHKTRTYIG